MVFKAPPPQLVQKQPPAALLTPKAPPAGIPQMGSVQTGGQDTMGIGAGTVSPVEAAAAQHWVSDQRLGVNQFVPPPLTGGAGFVERKSLIPGDLAGAAAPNTKGVVTIKPPPKKRVKDTFTVQPGTVLAMGLPPPTKAGSGAAASAATGSDSGSGVEAATATPNRRSRNKIEGSGTVATGTASLQGSAGAAFLWLEPRATDNVVVGAAAAPADPLAGGQ
jgi:hypothetical protein